jgi:predicted  nucleic acid-binding Zn-ribbon protein
MAIGNTLNEHFTPKLEHILKQHQTLREDLSLLGERCTQASKQQPGANGEPTLNALAEQVGEVKQRITQLQSSTLFFRASLQRWSKWAPQDVNQLLERMKEVDVSLKATIGTEFEQADALLGVRHPADGESESQP